MGTDYECIRITNVLGLLDYWDFVSEAVEATKEHDNEHSLEQILRAIRAWLPKPEMFSLWIQKKAGVPVGFITAYVSFDVYGQSSGVIWMTYTKQEARLALMEASVRDWFYSLGVFRAIATSAHLGHPVRHRWLRKHGFKFHCEVWVRKDKHD